MRNILFRNQNREGVVTSITTDEFLIRQRDVLAALAGPCDPGEAFDAMIRRVARRGKLTVSKAAKAWRGYAVLRGDEWERCKDAVSGLQAGVLPDEADEGTQDGRAGRGRAHDFDADTVANLVARMEALDRKIDLALARLASEPDRRGAPALEAGARA
ncbi:hypothetical protein DFR50_14277 [Roseiarcus fermentans]|uniref:Uncharacterized protein n=1 Tax=Roseiarcus fermentans TaxID=1473586 RepID=A0A366EQP6_9HYPH|nr:hypothetical protein [Roseiarcus fermentans]RBP03829.1 hypothetical protein DFR50_14277 [Roseiarcus fermentans]